MDSTAPQENHHPFHLDPESVRIQPGEGGTTNVLFTVHLDRPLEDEEKGRTKDDTSLIFRMNGTGSESLIDRRSESFHRILLSRRGLSPPLTASFDNGVVYAFVPGRILSKDELKSPRIAKGIALEMAKWHQIRPCPGEGLILEPVLWKWMHKFLSLIPAEILEKQSTSVIPSKTVLSSRIDSLARESSKRFHSGIVLCHNDLSCGNILVDDVAIENGSVVNGVLASGLASRTKFIDLEYGGWNHPSFDIANHFTEFTGPWGDEEEEDLGLDFSLCPDSAEKSSWIMFYLQCRRYLNEKEKKYGEGNHVSDSDSMVDIESFSVPARDIEEVLAEVNLMEEAAHLFWSLWALNQAAMSEIQASFLKYAQIRFRQAEIAGKAWRAADSK